MVCVLRVCGETRSEGEREERKKRPAGGMIATKKLLLVTVLALLLLAEPAEGGKKKKKVVKQKKKGKTSVSFGAAEEKGFELGESDEEFMRRLTGSDRPQAARIVTGVDPRKKDEAEAPTELTPEQKAAKQKREEGRRTTELWKVGTIAKELAGRWKTAGEPSVLFPQGDNARREKMAATLADTAGIKIIDKA